MYLLQKIIFNEIYLAIYLLPKIILNKTRPA